MAVTSDTPETAQEALKRLSWVVDELMRPGTSHAFAYPAAATDDLVDALQAIDRLKLNAMARVAIDANLVTKTGRPTTSRERREAFRRQGESTT